MHCVHDRGLHSFPTRRSSDLKRPFGFDVVGEGRARRLVPNEGEQEVLRRMRKMKANDATYREIAAAVGIGDPKTVKRIRSEEHTSELQSPCNLVCRLLLEKKN